MKNSSDSPLECCRIRFLTNISSLLYRMVAVKDPSFNVFLWTLLIIWTSDYMSIHRKKIQFQKRMSVFLSVLTPFTSHNCCLIQPHLEFFTKKIVDIGRVSFEPNLSISCLFYTWLKANSLTLNLLVIFCCGSPTNLLPCLLQEFLVVCDKKNCEH